MMRMPTMTASPMLRAILLLLLLPVTLGEARGAVQPPPANCLLPSCILGTSANGKWIAQPFSGGSGTVGPAGPQGPAGPAGPQGPQGIAGAAGVNGGPLASKTYVAGTALSPGLWYGIYGTANVAIPLPAAGVAPWTNPAIVCFTNYGDKISAVGQVTFTSTSPIYGFPSSLGFMQTVCAGIDDVTPPGWHGDGGS